MRSRLRSSLCAPALALALTPGFARAECPDPPHPARPADPAEAERLFVEAKQLMKEARIPEACDKLETSYALDPGGGTIMQLAYCLELEGKLAASHARYEEALQIAGRDDNERRAALAREHLAALGPRLTRIEIRVSLGAKAQAGLEIRRDGRCVDPSSWDKAVAVDPGKHVVTASAAGKKTWQIGVDPAPEGSTTLVDIPELEEPTRLLPAPAPSPLPPAPDASRGGSWTPGVVVTSTGVAGLGIGAVTGGLTLAAARRIDATCHGGLCPPSQQGQGQKAQTLGKVSNLAFMAGGSVTAVGVFLLAMRPFGRRPAVAAVKVGPASVALVGRF